MTRGLLFALSLPFGGLAGEVRIQPSSQQGFCLDLPGADATPGNTVWMWECNGSPGQNWIVDHSANIIKFADDTSKCIDVENGNLAAGTHLQLWDCNGKSNQNFAYDGQGFGVAGHFCMDVPGNDAYNGALMWVWDCNAQDSQKFNLEGDAPSGQVTIMPANDEHFCLDLPGGDATPGTTVWMWECNGKPSQQWIVGSTLQFAGDPNMCVDVTSGNMAAGTQLQLWGCNGTPQQNIEYFSATQTFWLPTASSDAFCMDVPGGQAYNGALMWIWDCNGQSSQEFTWSAGTPTPTPTPPPPGPPTPPCPAPSPSPDDCPGGSLEACVSGCPGQAGSSERQTCVDACFAACQRAKSKPSSQGSLETYPAPSDSFPRGPFGVSVEQDGGSAQDSFVYQSFSPNDAPDAQQGRTVSWTTFAFTGTVTVKVRAPSNSWQEAVIRPLSLGISVCRDGDAAVFTMTQPGHVVVEFDGDMQNSLLIFGEAPEADEDKSATVVYGPGEWDIGTYVVNPGTSIRLEGGAYVRGNFVTGDNGGDGIKIIGRGVLSGENIPHNWGGGDADDQLGMLTLCGDDITIRGITIVNPPTYLVNINPYWLGCGGVRTLVEGVKAWGWYFTTDGIMVGRNSIVRGNFVRANDDALKVYMSNTLWEKNTIWQADNGQSFMLSWNTPESESNITVKDCTVVHVEHAWDYGDNARPSVFGSVHGGTGQLSQFYFENIIIEVPVFRPFGFSIAANPWGGAGTGSISDVTLQGVSFWGAAQTGSKINGNFHGACFKGLMYEGQLITSATLGNFDVSLGAYDIQFSSALNVSSALSAESLLI